MSAWAEAAGNVLDLSQFKKSEDEKIILKYKGKELEAENK